MSNGLAPSAWRAASLAVRVGCSGGAAALASSSSSASASSGTSASASSTSWGAPPGECISDAECFEGTCVELLPGGYRVCRQMPAPINSCAPGEMGCCNSDVCLPGQRCFPPVGSCGGLVGPMNRCLGDGCQSDSDCDAGVCAAAGELGLFVNTCIAALGCRRDADCTAKPGGVCRPIEDACCSGVYALYCFYPGGTSKADCETRGCGDPATGVATCASMKPVCPT
jgi:hypothetical protein